MTLYYLYEVEYTTYDEGEPHTKSRYEIVEKKSGLSDQESIRYFGHVGYAVSNLVRWVQLGKWYWDDDNPDERRMNEGPDTSLVLEHEEAFVGTDWEYKR